MKLLCASAFVVFALAGCGDKSQEIPAGASYKDPTGANANGAGASTGPSKLQTDMAAGAQRTAQQQMSKGR